MEIAIQFLSLLGGLGMFLFGMNTMSSGLEHAAGEKLKTIIDKVTGNLFKSVLLGTVVAGVTQSSSATTVMVVGFVNAGILSLNQAVGIIMGANIGTTVTAWIVSLGDLPGGVWYLELLKPSTIAPAALIVGACLLFFCNTKKLKIAGEFLVGLGILFIGMEYMSGAMEVVFEEIPALSQLFATDSNPFVGILIGAGVTAVIQSSSASVAMLQAVASSTTVAFSSAFPIIMGQNIGTCITAVLSAIGTNKNAKRAAAIHLYFNIIGTIIFLTVIYLVNALVGISFWDTPVGATQISIFHSVFNITVTIILLPFTKFLVFLANKTIRDKAGDEKGETGDPFALLDRRFLSTPSIAVNNVQTTMSDMFAVSKKNVQLCHKAFKTGNDILFTEIYENEKLLDDYEIRLTDYLTQISDTQLSHSDNITVAAYFHIVNNIERIGDYCINLCENMRSYTDAGNKFSQDAEQGLNTMFSALENIVEISMQAFKWNDTSLVCKIEPLEEVIDGIQEKLERMHMERLKKKQCAVEIGVIYMEMISNMERIADHCSNIGVSILQANDDARAEDRHAYKKQLHLQMPGDYKENYEHYMEKYSV